MEIKYTKSNIEVPDVTKLDEAAGYMVRISEKRLIRPFDIQEVKTGISLKIPKGYELEVLTLNRILRETGVGVLSGIESYPPEFEGEIKVTLKNFKPNIVVLEKSMPIARMFLRKVEDMSFVSSDKKATSTKKEEPLASGDEEIEQKEKDLNNKTTLK